MGKKIKFAFLLFWNFLYPIIAELHCGHDKISSLNPIPQKNISTFEKRMRQTYKLFDIPIRIHIDSSNLNSVGRERDLIISVMSKKKLCIIQYENLTKKI
jgi:hypothetical protein